MLAIVDAKEAADPPASGEGKKVVHRQSAIPASGMLPVAPTLKKAIRIRPIPKSSHIVCTVTGAPALLTAIAGTQTVQQEGLNSNATPRGVKRSHAQTIKSGSQNGDGTSQDANDEDGDVEDDEDFDEDAEDVAEDADELNLDADNDTEGTELGDNAEDADEDADNVKVVKKRKGEAKSKDATRRSRNTRLQRVRVAPKLETDSAGKFHKPMGAHGREYHINNDYLKLEGKIWTGLIVRYSYLYM